MPSCIIIHKTTRVNHKSYHNLGDSLLFFILQDNNSSYTYHMLAVGHELHSLQRGHFTSRLMFTVFLTERNLNVEQFVTDAMYEYNILFKKKK